MKAGDENETFFTFLNVLGIIIILLSIIGSFVITREMTALQSAGLHRQAQDSNFLRNVFIFASLFAISSAPGFILIALSKINLKVNKQRAKLVRLKNKLDKE